MSKLPKVQIPVDLVFNKEDYAICPECGGIMKYDEKFDVYTCAGCNRYFSTEWKDKVYE